MPATDPEEYRAASRESWSGAAAGWGTHREVLQAAAEPVSHWMVDAIDPQPGHRVLELAAGSGDTGFLAAELIEPGGRLISSDVVEEMLDQARARAGDLGITNVEFRVIDAEWIDLPTASLDGVLVRWGYMLLADPATALRETRRVLRPGGRLALAAWADPADNPWASVPRVEMAAMGAVTPPTPDAPDMFAFRDPQRIVGLLEDTGFEDIVVEPLAIVYRYPSLDDWWDTMLDISVDAQARGQRAHAGAARRPARRDRRPPGAVRRRRRLGRSARTDARRRSRRVARRGCQPGSGPAQRRSIRNARKLRSFRRVGGARVFPRRTC